MNDQYRGSWSSNMGLVLAATGRAADGLLGQPPKEVIRERPPPDHHWSSQNDPPARWHVDVDPEPPPLFGCHQDNVLIFRCAL